MFPIDRSINSIFSSISNPFFNNAFYIATWLFNFWPFCILLLFTVLVAWKWSSPHERKRTIILLIGSPVLAAVLTWILKFTFNIARPINERLQVFGPSFPSSHTAVATAYFLILLHFARQTKNKYRRIVHYLFCILCPVFVGVSRLYFEVHWFSDVLAGYILGAFSVYVVIRLFKRTNL